MNYQNSTQTAASQFVGGNIGSAVGIGYPTVTGNQVSPLDEVAKAIDNAQVTAVAATQRIREIADNLLGTAPEPKNGDTAPQRMGRIGSLNDQADRLNWQLNELLSQLHRLAVVG